MEGKAMRGEVRTVVAGGRTMAVALGGHATPPAVLLHGIPGSRGTWAEVAARLEPRRWICPDLVGFGGSGALPEGMHAAGQAEAVLALLDALGVGTFHLAGFDFGGPTAVEVWRRAPGRIRSLALAATNLFTDTPVPPPLRVARLPVLGDLAFRVLFGRTGLRLMWWAACGDRRAFPRARFEAAFAGAGVESTRRIFLDSLRDLAGRYRDVEAALAGVAVPALVCWGDQDPFFRLAVGERSAAAIPGARLLVLRGAGHFVPEERPEGVATALEELHARADRSFAAGGAA